MSGIPGGVPVDKRNDRTVFPFAEKRFVAGRRKSTYAGSGIQAKTKFNRVVKYFSATSLDYTVRYVHE